jgi:hypothetical protein
MCLFGGPFHTLSTYTFNNPVLINVFASLNYIRIVFTPKRCDAGLGNR